MLSSLAREWLSRATSSSSIKPTRRKWLQMECTRTQLSSYKRSAAFNSMPFVDDSNGTLGLQQHVSVEASGVGYLALPATRCMSSSVVHWLLLLVLISHGPSTLASASICSGTWLRQWK